MSSGHPRSIVMRNVRHGRIESALPQFLLVETDDHIVTCIIPGIVGKMWTLYRQEDWIQRMTGRWDLTDHTWHTRRALIVTRFGEAFSLGVHWDDATNRFLGWYVNLQAPLRRTVVGFDTLDHTLDIWVDPDRSWSWKDCDELSELERQGRFTRAEADAIRTVGRHVIDNLDTLVPIGWEAWQPDPDWPLPTFPERWDRV